jgi:hypothetical protein
MGVPLSGIAIRMQKKAFIAPSLLGFHDKGLSEG